MRFIGRSKRIENFEITTSVGGWVSPINSVASRITDDESTSRVWLAGFACLAIGALCGLINGLIVAYGRLQPIIVTLATFSVYSGIALYVRPTPAGEFPFEATQYWTGSMVFRDWPRGIVPRRLPRRRRAVGRASIM